MGRRRRNLLILLFVVGLTAASAIVIASKPTVLGLDLRGGTQLIYQAEETARTPNIGADEIDRAIEIIRERADKLGVSEPEISRLGEKGIQVGLPDVQNAEQAIEQIGTTSQLYFYDFEANVVPPPGQGVPKDPAQPAGPTTRTSTASPTSTTRSSSPRSESPSASRTSARPTGRPTTCSSATPTSSWPARRRSRQDLFLQFRNEKQPPGSQIIAVPQGTVVVQAESEDPTLSQSPSEVSATPHYVLQDRPALSGDDIKNPEQSSDPTTNQPNVTFDFTDDGQRRVPGGHPDDRPARRGDRPARRGRRGRRPVLAALLGGAGRPGRHPADHQLLREPGLGSTGAPGRRSPATSRSARRRTWPSSCASGRCRSTSSSRARARSRRRSASRRSTRGCGPGSSA